MMKIHRSNIKVFNIKIKNHNNARNFENIILISLGINFIILAWAYYLIIKKKKMQGKQQYDESFINNERQSLLKRIYFRPLHINPYIYIYIYNIRIQYIQGN